MLAQGYLSSSRSCPCTPPPPLPEHKPNFIHNFSPLIQFQPTYIRNGAFFAKIKTEPLQTTVLKKELIFKCVVNGLSATLK